MLKSYLQVKHQSAGQGYLVFEDTNSSLWSSLCVAKKLVGAALDPAAGGFNLPCQLPATVALPAPQQVKKNMLCVASDPQHLFLATQDSTQSLPVLATLVATTQLGSLSPSASQLVTVVDCGAADHSLFASNDLYQDLPDNEPLVQRSQEPGPGYEAATNIKSYATSLYKNKQYSEALRLYQKAFRYAAELIPDNEQHPSQYVDFKMLMLTLSLNICLAALQSPPPLDLSLISNHAGSVIDSDLAKPADKAKAYFRRGQANASAKSWAKAILDYKAALALVPNDPAITKQLHAAETIVAAQNNAQKAAYSKFFS